MKTSTDSVKEWFIQKYGTICYYALQEWYLSPKQEHKTASSIEEIWGEAWLACLALNNPKAKENGDE